MAEMEYVRTDIDDETGDVLETWRPIPEDQSDV